MFPRWLSWLVLTCILYLMVNGVLRNRTPENVPAPAAETAATPHYPALSAATDLERWKRAINPDYAQKDATCSLSGAPVPDHLGPHRIDLAPGHGDAAKCGDTIRLRVVLWNAQGAAAQDVETSLTLGAQALAEGIDAGLMGIRPHGARTLILPPAVQTRAKSSTAPKALRDALSGSKVAIVTITRLEDIPEANMPETPEANSP